MHTMEQMVAYFLVILGMITMTVGMLCGFILWMTRHYSQLWPTNGEDGPMEHSQGRDIPARRTTNR